MNSDITLLFRKCNPEVHT